MIAYKLDKITEPLKLLEAVGGLYIDEQGHKVSLSHHVYMSRSDLEAVADVTREAYEKEYKHEKPEIVEYFLGTHLLDFLPSAKLSEVLKPGYIVVDETSIVRDIGAYEKQYNELYKPKQPGTVNPGLHTESLPSLGTNYPENGVSKAQDAPKSTCEGCPSKGGCGGPLGGYKR